MRGIVLALLLFPSVARAVLTEVVVRRAGMATTTSTTSSTAASTTTTTSSTSSTVATTSSSSSTVATTTSTSTTMASEGLSPIPEVVDDFIVAFGSNLQLRCAPWVPWQSISGATKLGFINGTSSGSTACTLALYDGLGGSLITSVTGDCSTANVSITGTVSSFSITEGDFNLACWCRDGAAAGNLVSTSVTASVIAAFHEILTAGAEGIATSTPCTTGAVPPATVGTLDGTNVQTPWFKVSQ